MTEPTSTDDLRAIFAEYVTLDATVERVARALWPFLFVEEMGDWDAVDDEDRTEALDAARAALAAALVAEGGGDRG